MSVQLVANGFFRSGTSILWQILKDSNRDHVVFYEPCHHELLMRVERYRRAPSIEPLHGMCLWQEYLDCPGLMDRLRWTHPNVGKVFPDTTENLLAYLRVYQSLPDFCLLQSNRWHFFLEAIHQETRCGIVHLVRNPFDIYRSIRVAYLSEGDRLSRFKKWLLWDVLPGQAFQIQQMYAAIFQRYGLPPNAITYTGTLRHRPLSTWNQFLVAWTMTNFEAIRQTDAVGGIVQSYEALLHDASGFAEQLERKYALQFCYEGVLRNGKSKEFLPSPQRDLLRPIMQRLGIEREFQYITARVQGERQEAVALARSG